MTIRLTSNHVDINAILAGTQGQGLRLVVSDTIDPSWWRNLLEDPSTQDLFTVVGTYHALGTVQFGAQLAPSLVVQLTRLLPCHVWLAGICAQRRQRGDTFSGAVARSGTFTR